MGRRTLECADVTKKILIFIESLVRQTLERQIRRRYEGRKEGCEGRREGGRPLTPIQRRPDRETDYKPTLAKG